MIFITGDTGSKKIIKILQENLWGRMVVDRKITPYLYEPWAFDNGAYRYFLHNKPFDENEFSKRLEMANEIGIPYMAVVPDIVAGGLESLDFSMKWIDKMPYDWYNYLAVQDGITEQDIIPIIHKFDGIFIGGSDSFKATTWHWVKLAKEYGKKTHYGRVSTPRKLLHAIGCGVDSCDSTFVLWDISRLHEFVDILKNGYKQQHLMHDEEMFAISPSKFCDDKKQLV